MVWSGELSNPVEVEEAYAVDEQEAAFDEDDVGLWVIVRNMHDQGGELPNQFDEQNDDAPF